jgi:hypothetical protein
MEYSKETINSAKKIMADVFEAAAKQRDADRQAKKMQDEGWDKETVREVYRSTKFSK